MTWRSVISGGLARGLLLLSVVLLVAGPITPAAATPMDCCADAPCHDLGKSACPEICVVACQVIVAPAFLISEPIRPDAPLAAPVPGVLPPGRAVAPDLPPPR